MGNALAQLGHACLLAGDSFPQPPIPPNIVVLGVADEAALLKAIERAKRNGINIISFYEPDFPQGYTAAATEPIDSSKRHVFKRYSLLT